MTCHTRAAVNHGVAVRGLSKAQLDGSVPLPLEFLAIARPAPNPVTSYSGAPDPDWFFQRHSGSGQTGDMPIVFPVDFLWQLPLQAKARLGFNQESSD